MNQPSVFNLESKSTQRLLLLWAVTASVFAALFFILLVSRESQNHPAASDAKPADVSNTLPPIVESISEPPSMEMTGSPILEPPPTPPLPDIYISDLKPLSFLTGYGSSGINHNVEGKPLVIEGKTYERGLGTHAYGEAVFNIPTDARRFVAVVGLDDSVRGDKFRRGSVCFEVYGDLDEPGQPLIPLGQSPVLSPKTILFWNFNLELDPALKRIMLIASDAGDGKDCDWADWVNAGFLTAKHE